MPRRRNLLNIVETFTPDPARCAAALLRLLRWEPPDRGPAPDHDPGPVLDHDPGTGPAPPAPAGTAKDHGEAGEGHGPLAGPRRADREAHVPRSEAR